MGRPKLKELSDHDFLELYHEGLMDVEIAEIMGVKAPTVRARRVRMGLPKNTTYHRFTQRFSVHDGNTLEFLFEGTVREIAEYMGIKPVSVRSNIWRCRHGVVCRYLIYEVTA